MALARKTDAHNNGKEPGYDEWKKKRIEQGLRDIKAKKIATDAEVEAAFRSFSEAD